MESNATTSGVPRASWAQHEMISPAVESLGLTDAHVLAYVVVGLSVGYWLLGSALVRSKDPVATAWTGIEPALLQNFRFYLNAGPVLQQAYQKFKDRVFRVVRVDADILILPPKYVHEVRVLSNDVASPTVAHAHNLMGSHTNMNIILKNNLHFRTLQEKLTPNLGSLTHPMQDELNYAIERELPQCADEWVAIKPYHSILKLVARISARIFLGLPVCRNEDWLEVSTEFTENVFVSLVVLRLLPPWMHGLVSWILPTTWRGHAYIRQAKKLLVPEINRRREQAASGHVEDSDNLLSWMMELAGESEGDAASLAHLEVVMSLASIHTSQMNAVHVLYDLAAQPQYIDELREEILQVIAEDGNWMSWKKSAFSKLRKLDSFMRESQRLNPPTLLSMHRVMMEEHVLHDGYVLEKGAHIAMAVNAIQNDITPDADTFDGLRYYKLRERPGESHLHQFSTTEKNILNFGHGKNACPGRFFAGLEIKNILVRLIMDFDFKLMPGQGRPANLTAHEFIFPNPDGQLMIRQRLEKDRLII